MTPPPPAGGPLTHPRAPAWVALVVGSFAALGLLGFAAHTLRDEGAAGRTRVVGTLAPRAGAPFLLCRVAWRKGDVTWTETVHEGIALERPDGQALVIAPGVPLETLATAPPTGPPRPGERERSIALARGHRGSDVACLHPGDGVAVSGCVGAGDPGLALVPCPGSDAVLLAPGASAQVLVDVRRAEAAGWMAVGLFAAAVSLGAATWLARAPRPRAPAGEVGAGRAALLLGAIVLGVIAALLRERTASAYLLTASAIAVLVAVAAGARPRPGEGQTLAAEAPRRRGALAMIVALSIALAVLGGAAGGWLAAG